MLLALICLYFFLSTSIILMIVNFCGFCILPQLKNVHGYIFTSYIVAYIGTYFPTLVELFALDEGKKFSPNIINQILSMYFNLACPFWMFAASYEIWRSLRDFNIVDRNESERNKKKILLRYGIFGWGTPFATYLVMLVSLGNTAILILVFSVVPVILISCNIIFFLCRGWTIWKNEKNIQNLISESNERQIRHKKQFSFYLKTSLVMSIHGIGWIPFLVSRLPSTVFVMLAIDMLHSVLMFYFFVWKFLKKLLRQKCLTLCRRSNAGNELSTEQETRV